MKDTHADYDAQVYFARFCIIHSLHMPIPDGYNNVESIAIRRALAIGNVAIESYVMEMTTWVKEELVSELSKALVEQSVDLMPELTHAKERARFVKRWLKSNRPFSNEVTTLSNLIRAIVDDPDQLAAGLPRSEPPQMSPREFAERLYKMCKPVENGRKRIEAPLLSKGASHFAISAAISYFARYSGTSDAQTLDNFCVTILTHNISTLQLHNVPWSQPQGQGRGRRSKKPTIKHWISLGLASTADGDGDGNENGRNILNLGPRTARTQAAISGASFMTLSNSNAPYSMTNARWEDVGVFLDKAGLPDDWTLDHVGMLNMNDYVGSTYSYVRAYYDHRKPIHQLALLAGLVMSKMVPEVFPPCSRTPNALAGCKDASVINKAVRELSWVTSSGQRKGSTAAKPFLTMFSTMVIGLYEERSPLREHMRDHRGSLGVDWTQKHG